MSGLDSECRAATIGARSAGRGEAQVAQLVEHVTENRGVGGSIPPLGTILFQASAAPGVGLIAIDISASGASMLPLPFHESADARNRRRQGHRHLSGAQFRHAEDRDERRAHRPRRRHPERARTGRRHLSHRPCHPLPDRARRAPYRGHLAVSSIAAPIGGAGRSPCAAIAAVDMALWDIKAKAAGPAAVSVAGRRAAAKARWSMAMPMARTIEETLDKAQSTTRSMGYKAIRLQSGVPGLKSTYGVSKDRYFYEPADADLPTENLWSSEKYLRSVPAAVREGARSAGLGRPSAARHPSPADADRGRPAGQGSGALSAVLAGRRDAGREPGQFPPDPPAHHHAAGGGRDLQHASGTASS